MRWRRRLLIGLVVLAAVWAGWSLSRNRFVFTNGTGQAIRSLTVEVCGRTYRFEDIPPGASVSGRFGTPEDEAVFAVRFRLEDGTEIDEHCGYVVWEDYGRRFGFVIRPGGEVASE